MPRTRTERVRFYLSKPELERLNRCVQKSGLSKEAYLRSLTNGLVPQDKPPPDFYSMMNELHAIGNNLNQIAYKANSLGLIDAARYDAETKHLREITQQIYRAVLEPVKL
jgi:hypothetical protein